MKNFESSTAKIISQTLNGSIICGTAGKISTTAGTTLSVLLQAKQSQDKNANLISKILSSGHKTIIEHHYFNIAFNNVSVLVEQFLIEFRLTSFTIKSRRYVDFSKSGYIIPKNFTKAERKEYTKCADNLFLTYSKLIECGIPKEDARFLLPYAFKSNIICSCNARELMHIICTMLYGRGSEYDEIKKLGTKLKTQFDKIYPGQIEKEQKHYANNKEQNYQTIIYNPSKITYTNNKVELINYPQKFQVVVEDCKKLLNLQDVDYTKILNDGKTARLLEQFNFTFKINNISLGSLTHLTRHRMQSIIVPNLHTVINENKYILPESIKDNSNALKMYKSAIASTCKSMELFNKNIYNLPYLFVSGRTLNVITTINARELMWLFKLRTCERAQWEINEITVKMLSILRKKYPTIFDNFGPSCFLLGYCPEGRLTCGKLKTKENFKC